MVESASRDVVAAADSCHLFRKGLESTIVNPASFDDSESAVVYRKNDCVDTSKLTPSCATGPGR